MRSQIHIAYIFLFLAVFFGIFSFSYADENVIISAQVNNNTSQPSAGSGGLSGSPDTVKTLPYSAPKSVLLPNTALAPVASEKSPTSITFSGKANPNAYVIVLKNGLIIANKTTDKFGNFLIPIPLSDFGNYTFSVFTQSKTDKNNSEKISFSLVVTSGVDISVSGIFLPPIINLEKSTIKSGDNIKISGMTVPLGIVSIYLDENKIYNTNANLLGVYTYNIPSKGFALGTYQIKAKTYLTSSVSPFGKIIPFTILNKSPAIVSNKQPLISQVNGENFLFFPKDSFVVGHKLGINLLVDAKNEAINSLQGNIVFPDSLSVDHIDTNNSIVNNWIKSPSVKNNQIIFSGSIAGDFNGLIDPFVPKQIKPAPVFTIYFTPKISGPAKIEFKAGSVFLDDSFSTEIKTAPFVYSIDLAASSLQSLPADQNSLISSKTFLILVLLTIFLTLVALYFKKHRSK